MKISANVGGNNYGGYSRRNYIVEIYYEDWNGNPWEADYSENSALLERLLTYILLGQASPTDIKTDWKTYVHAGEIIEKHHIEEFVSDWPVDFTETPWAEKIADLNKHYADEAFKKDFSEGAVKITIDFDYKIRGQLYPKNKQGHQFGGKLTLNPDVARWLGKQLIALAEGSLSAQSAGVEFSAE
jgi:hypothetical protein